MTMSIGLGQYRPGEEMREFVQRVDHLMYEGKKAGKDRVNAERQGLPGPVAAGD